LAGIFFSILIFFSSLYAIQLVTPSVVASAVSMLMSICTSVFHVSFFIAFLGFGFCFGLRNLGIQDCFLDSLVP